MHLVSALATGIRAARIKIKGIWRMSGRRRRRTRRRKLKENDTW
jgi:hypothetical protein